MSADIWAYKVTSSSNIRECLLLTCAAVHECTVTVLRVQISAVTCMDRRDSTYSRLRGYLRREGTVPSFLTFGCSRQCGQFHTPVILLLAKLPSVLTYRVGLASWSQRYGDSP